MDVKNAPFVSSLLLKPIAGKTTVLPSSPMLLTAWRSLVLDVQMFVTKDTRRETIEGRGRKRGSPQVQRRGRTVDCTSIDQTEYVELR